MPPSHVLPIGNCKVFCQTGLLRSPVFSMRAYLSVSPWRTGTCIGWDHYTCTHRIAGRRVAVDLKERLARFRDEEKRLAWEGTFLEYFDTVKARPAVANLAHARVYDMIMDAGVVKEENGHNRFRFFEHDIFGLDRPLEQLVEYFSSAAKRLEVRKRILLLMGPVGGGKSTLVSLMKRGMEQYSRTEAGAIYAIKGCPMHEEPLHLIPPEMREEIYKEYGIYIEGDLCPACQQMLKDQYGGKMEEVKVQRMAFSEKTRVGIGTFTPSDPKSQDISELTGSVDLSTIGQYGSESDPRAYRFDGELNVANRGLMEFIEMLKSNAPRQPGGV
jgi:serine protein kinase